MKLQQRYIDILVRLMKNSAKKGNLANSALVLEGNTLLGSAESLVASSHDATAHSEKVLVHKICKKRGNNYTPGLRMITVVEPCTMCLSACSQAGYKSIEFIIAARPYIERFPWVTDGIPIQKKQDLSQQFSEKIKLIHLKEYEVMFRKVFDIAMKDLFIK